MVLSSRAQSYIIGNDVLMVFSGLVVSIRFYIRMRHSQRGLWWDDLSILMSMIAAAGFGCVVNISMGHYGWDQNLEDITVGQEETDLKLYVIAKILFIIAGGFIRMSLLCFYLWLVRDLGNCKLRRIIHWCILGNAAISVFFCLFSALECRPVSAFYQWPRPAGSKCLDDGKFTMAFGALLTAADLIVNILPLPVVAKLHLPVRRRVTIGVLLSAGAIATMAGIVREIWVWKALIADSDTRREALPLFICADVEIYVGLLCACAPSMKPLTNVFRRKFATFRKRHNPDADKDDVVVLRRQEHWDIFDGSLSANFTHICATRDRRNFKLRSMSGSHQSDEEAAGIQVVTHIQMKSLDDS